MMRPSSTDAADHAAALRDPDAMFRDGIDAIGEGFVLFDEYDRLVTWNRAYARMFPDSVAGFHVGMPFADTVRHAIATRRRDEPDFDVENRVAWRMAIHLGDGTPLDLVSTAGYLVEAREHRTRAGGIAIVYRDVSEERRARQALEVSERRFRDFAEITADWFWELDAQYRYRFVSDASHQITSRLPSDLYGTRPMDDRPAGVCDQAWHAHLDALARQERFVDFRFETVDLLGRRRVVAISGKPVHGAEGRFDGYRGIGRDVTDAVAAEKRIEEALARERSAAAHQKRFVAVAAHEFRTPLTIIDGAAQRLLRHATQLTQEELRERVQRIRTAVARMAQLIETTLDSARFDGGAIELKPTTIDLARLVSVVCARQQTISSDFTFAVADEGHGLEIVADPRLLDLAFTNLIGNAVKYSGASRRVEVTILRDHDHASVRVRDFGIGIPAAELEKLFARFYRASTAKGIPGTGIGLHLVKELISAHGGEVRVASAPGAGSTFEARVPIRPVK